MSKKSCGKRCLRCWRNELKHTNTESTKYLINHEHDIEAENDMFEIAGEFKESKSRWQKFVTAKEEFEQTDEFKKQQADRLFVIEKKREEFNKAREEKQKRMEEERQKKEAGAAEEEIQVPSRIVVQQIMRECFAAY